MRMRSDPPWTLAEYDEFVQSVPDKERWELSGGKIWKMMTGGTLAHNVIIGNIATALRRGFREQGRPCRVYTENVQIRSAESEFCFYPDVVVSCGRYDPTAEAVDEPVLIVEVLSRTSRDRDERTKLLEYRSMPSLAHYILVEQTHPMVRLTTRSEAETWSWAIYEGSGARFPLTAFGFDLTSDEIYADVFEDPAG